MADSKDRDDLPLPSVLTDEERRDIWVALTVSLFLPLFLGLVAPAYGLAFIFLFLPILLSAAFAVILVKTPYDWHTENVTIWRALGDVLSRIRPLMTGVPTGEDVFRDGFAWKKVPFVTLALIAINAALFYWLPEDWTVANAQEIGNFTIAQAFTSTFLHGSPGHLWGNMLFLWAFGGMLEPRMDRFKMLAAYLACGFIASVMSEVGYSWLMLQTGRSLGASGAISGLMGLAMVRCYFARISVSIPIFGLLGLFLPVGIRVRVHLLLLVVLYFLLDLLGTVRGVVHGQSGGTGYWAHVGGYLAGIGIGYAMGLFREGLAEKQRTRALEARSDDKPRGNRQDLIAWVEKNPDDVEAVLQLARLEAHPFKKKEGDALYRRAITALKKTDFRRAAEIYLEYWSTYDAVFPPAEQVLFAREFQRSGALDDAVRSLEKSMKLHPREDREHAHGREKALFLLGQLFMLIGLEDTAHDAFRQLLYEFPQTEMRAVAEQRLAQIGPVTRARAGEVAS
jgi:membrane associated rhomboid family serine protease